MGREVGPTPNRSNTCPVPPKPSVTPKTPHRDLSLAQPRHATSDQDMLRFGSFLCAKISYHSRRSNDQEVTITQSQSRFPLNMHCSYQFNMWAIIPFKHSANALLRRLKDCKGLFTKARRKLFPTSTSYIFPPTNYAHPCACPIEIEIRFQT